jgi:glycosyltransferase involved in cell wall biosynthesis
VRAANLIVFQSDYDRLDFISRNADAASCTRVVRGDISGPRFKKEHAEANTSTSLRRIAFIGPLGKRKGLDYLVEAIGMLAARGVTDLHFDILGPGQRHEEIARVLKDRGLAERVTVSGRIPDPFVKLAAVDLLVVPSLFDSYPNIVLEALHVGTPVIGSRVGGIPDQLVHDELLFPPMDADAIADRIERCVREPAFYTRLRELCSQRRSAFEFDWAEAWEVVVRERLADLKKAPCALP